MTYIRQISMTGFKSFGDRTVTINFSKGFTCIVGPNGAGKSNIIDALCFALGRLSKKTMRAKSLEDLIFAGTTGKNPSRRAAVTITFDNSEGVFPGGTETFEITRIIKRGGSGKYKMNGKTATRQQILDALARGNIDPDGSNQFILQGKIVELTHMSADERRKFIEELIGLEKYDEMKDATYKELEKAERDLGQFEAIFKEVSGQLKKVEREKNDALAWKELEEKINLYNAQLIALKIAKLQEEEKELDENIDTAKRLIKELEEKITREENLLKQESMLMENIQRKISEKESERENMMEAITNLKTNLSSMKTELSLSEQRSAKLAQEVEKLRILQMHLEDGQTYDLLINEMKNKISESEKQIENAKSEIEQRQQHQAEIEEKINAHEKKKAEYNSQISLKKQEISSYQTQIRILKENIKKNEEKKAKLIEELNRLKGESENIETAIKATKLEEGRLRERIELLKQNISQENERQKELELKINQLLQKRNEISSNLSSLQTSLTSLDTEIKIQKENIENLEKKKFALEERIKELSNGKDTEFIAKELITRKNDLFKKIQDLKNKAKKNESIYMNNEKELDVWKFRQTTTNSEINTIQSKFENMQLELNIFEKELVNLQREKQGLELNSENLQGKLEKIEANLNNFIIKKENIQRRLSELLEEKESTIQKINIAEQEYEKNKEDIRAILQILNMLTQNIEISVDSIKGSIQQSNSEAIKLAGEDLRKFIFDIVDIMKTIESVKCEEDNIEEMENLLNSIRQTLDIFTENVDSSIEQLLFKVRESVDIAVQDSTANFDSFIQDLMEILENIHISLKTLTVSKSQDLYKQLEDITGSITAQQNELNTIEREIAETELNKEHDIENLNSTQARLKNINERLSELNDKVKDYKNNIEEKIQELQIKKDELNSVITEIDKIAAEKNSYWESLSKIQQEIEENQKLFDDLQEKLQDLQGIQSFYENINEIDQNIEELNKLIEINNGKKEGLEKEIQEVLEQRIKLQEEIDNLNLEKEKFWGKINDLNKEIDDTTLQLEKIMDKRRALENVQRIINSIEEISIENSEAKKEIEQSKTLMEKINSQIKTNQLYADNIQEIIDSLRAEKEQELKEQKEVQKQLNNLNKDLQKLQKDLNELFKNKEREEQILLLIEEKKITENKILELKNQIKLIEEELISENKRKDEKQVEIDELVAKKEESWDKQKALQKKISELKTSHSLETSKLSNFESKKIICVDQIETLYERSKDYGTLPPVPENLTESILQNQILDAINKKKALEPVNLKAIEQYDSIKERFDEIDMRRQTIQRERKAILDAIEKIELEKTKSFMKAYHEINRAFSNIFQKLSPGGSAKMILDRPDSPFEGGISIEARPRGKKISSLEILSGGEKTLVALSFIFAVQEFFPAPFYIMDEIDAALDSLNAYRVAMVIKEFAEQAQFIIISHREEVIVNAERIYGVSMQESGITDIFSVDLQSEAKKLLEPEKISAN
ncbi:MAG: AAA family ATPase [Promethearchaeota archaeon]